MDRELARIQRVYFFAYYRRLRKQALQEATHRWLSWFGIPALLAVLTFGLLLAAGGGGLMSAILGLVAFVVLWLGALAFYAVVIPPRIESEMQRKEETLQELTERRNVANELRNQMIQCRTSAEEARAVAIEPEHRGMIPDTFHQRALLVVRDAEDRLERLAQTTGQPPQEAHILELTKVVSSKKCASFDEAIDQLEGLANALERQLSSGEYW